MSTPLSQSFPWLVADIGGTNARFGWVTGSDTGVEHVHRLPVPDHAGPVEAVRAYLAHLADVLGNAYRPPRRAAFAVATAVAGDQIELTNSAWNFSRAAVQAELGLDALIMLNDFEALALSLPRLRPSQMQVHGALPKPQGTLAVIGPGTGLGVAGVIQTSTGWVALSFPLRASVQIRRRF